MGALALSISLAFYLAIATSSLVLPGLQYDEAFDAVVALEVLDGRRPSCAYSTRLFGPDLPLMVHSHIGPTSVYTSLAAFALLGVSVESLRLSQLAVGAVALLLLYVVGRAWFGAGVGAIAVVLCGSAPAFIWWSRGGANWTVPLLPLALGTVGALTHWWRRGSAAALALAAFLFGLGVTTKILFVWLALPMALTGIFAIGPRAIVGAIRRTSWYGIAIALGALLLGLAPMIAHNLPEPNTFNHVARNAVTTAWGHDNRDFPSNVARAITYFLATIDGEVLMAAPTVDGGINRLVFGLAVLYGAAGALWYLCRPARRSGEPRSTERGHFAAHTLLTLLPITVLPQSAITTSAISSTYVFVIVPFAWLLVAVMLRDAIAMARGRWTGLVRPLIGAAGVALLALILAGHVSSNLGLVRFFEQTGGRSQWSDAIYRTTEILEAHYPSRHVIALDWGFGRNIELLTNLQRRVTEGHEFRPAPSEGYPGDVARLLAEPGAILLAHADDVAVCSECFAVVERVAGAQGVELSLRHVVLTGDGRPHTLIYEVG